MKTFCLLKKHSDEFKKRLKNGEISPVKINNMTSEKRTEFFSSFMDKENAQKVNLLFEQKIVQKNKVNAMIRWAEEVSGVSTKQRQQMLETIKKSQDERIKRIFSPEEEESFLNDLVNQKLGVGVSKEESETIFRLSKQMQEGNDLFDKSKIYNKLNEIRGNLSADDKKVVDDLLVRIEGKKEGKEIISEATRKVKRYLEGEKPSDEVKKQISEFVDNIVQSRTEKSNAYGINKVALEKYIGDIKLGIKEPMSLRKVVDDVASFTKSVLSSLDNSFIGRQGIKSFYRGLGGLATGNIKPMKIWVNTFGDSFKTLYKAGIKGEKALDGIKAELYSRPNARAGRYKYLDVGIMEEAFPTMFPEKIPVIGRAFTASQEAFTGSAYRMRADLFDMYFEKFKGMGKDMDSKENLQALGNLVNSMTGRGKKGFGRLGKTTNATFFSPKFFQSNLDTLTAHLFDKEMPVFMKVEAGKNLLSIIGGVGTIMLISDQLKPGSVEWDPRSSDFGKIKIGDTRFDITGGMASIVTLVSRMVGGTKSTTTGLVTKSGQYGAKNWAELVANFAEGKLSPIAKTLSNVLKKEDFDRNPITLKAFKEDPANTAWIIGKGLFLPIPLQNIKERFETQDADIAIAATILDSLGVGANTYSFSDKWETKDTKEMQEFIKKEGKENVKKAGEEYSKEVNLRINEKRKEKGFEDLEDDVKLKEINKIKREIKNKIFNKYYFYK